MARVDDHRSPHGCQDPSRKQKDHREQEPEAHRRNVPQAPGAGSMDLDHGLDEVPDELHAGQHEADAEEPSRDRIWLRNDEPPARITRERADQWISFVGVSEGIV